jgi:hypothetical protein
MVQDKVSEKVAYLLDACSMKAEREKDNLEQYEAIIGASE